jgi:hypothetical protein
MMHDKLRNWEAHRSGAGMTVTGEGVGDLTGHVKLLGVKKIELRSEGPIAILSTGTEICLDGGPDTSAEVASIAGDLLNIGEDEILGLGSTGAAALAVSIRKGRRLVPGPAAMTAAQTPGCKGIAELAMAMRRHVGDRRQMNNAPELTRSTRRASFAGKDAVIGVTRPLSAQTIAADAQGSGPHMLAIGSSRRRRRRELQLGRKTPACSRTGERAR